MNVVNVPMFCCCCAVKVDWRELGLTEWLLDGRGRGMDEVILWEEKLGSPKGLPPIHFLCFLPSFPPFLRHIQEEEICIGHSGMWQTEEAQIQFSA
jgi:hypothetical protein